MAKLPKVQGKGRQRRIERGVNKSMKNNLHLAASLLALVWTNQAMAQEASPKVDQTGPGEIVVTAERRSQSLQKLPTTATAILGKDLERQQMAKVDDLMKSTPGLAINDAGLGKFINIRGVGKSADAPGVAPGVAYYALF